ncbi:MAG: hypothetical protein JWO52_4094 [Gammaproteobacteria bacterium]|nr:hypothetical protein [Gammaproteobacteria bacterium]
MNIKLPPAPVPSPFLPDANPGTAGTLHDFYYEQAQKSLNEPIPPAPSPPCAPIAAQAPESAGSPQVDWALDTRPSYKLTDAEALAKMHWHFAALCKREREYRAFDVPTIFPPGDSNG